MPLELEIVEDASDFNSIIPLLYAAYGSPYNSLRPFYIPIHTTLEDALESFKQRNLKKWKEREQRQWVKVTDADTGEMIGAGCWDVREEVEEVDGKKVDIDAFWHKEGSEERKFASRLMTQLKGFMKQRMVRRILLTHSELETLIVHPDHRNRGAGRMLIEWGTKKADDLGLESCIESVPFAVPIYEKCGFGTVDDLVPDMQMESPSENWKTWAAEDLRVLLCWRPVGRDFEKGKDDNTWKN